MSPHGGLGLFPAITPQYACVAALVIMGDEVRKAGLTLEMLFWRMGEGLHRGVWMEAMLSERVLRRAVLESSEGDAWLRHWYSSSSHTSMRRAISKMR